MKQVDFQQLAQFQPKQLEAWNTLFDNRCKYLLYGGAAHGGKSYFLRWASLGLALYYAKKYEIKGVQIGLFSETFPTLRDRQIIRIEREFPEWLGEIKDYTDIGLAFKLRDRYGGGIIMLRNLDDPGKYMSTEFAAEFVEELTRDKETVFDDLRFRLRYPGIDEVKFVGATNPGGIGHSWVKKLWVKPDFEHADLEQDKFFYIPATAYDNKFTQPGYLEQLRALPTEKRKAYLEGSWDIVAGQVFTEWNDATHVVKDIQINKDWNIYGSLDLGWNKPFAAGWYAVTQEARTYLFKELYGNSLWFEKKYGKPMTARRLARILNATSMKMEVKPKYWVGDPSMWNKILLGKDKDRREGESYAEIMIKAGLKLIPGDNNRLNGLARFREALALAPDGLPWYQVFNTCYDTIRTIPSLIYDEHNFEDVDTDGDDHCFDRDKYFFMSRPVKPVEKEKFLTPIQEDKQRRIEKLKGDNEEKLLEDWIQT